jgi:predicted DNA-binding transcriptional regulator AlpA
MDNRDLALGPAANGEADSEPTAAPAISVLLIGIGEVARMLGVSRRSLERFEMIGGLGPRRIQLVRLVRFRRDEVLAWVDAGAPARDRWSWPPRKR